MILTLSDNHRSTVPPFTSPPALHLRLRTLLPSLSISSNPNRFKAQTPNRQFPNRFHSTHLKSLINFNFPITRRFSLMFLLVYSFGCWSPSFLFEQFHLHLIKPPSSSLGPSFHPEPQTVVLSFRPNTSISMEP
ncbi:hypothetical protein P8452_26221 [Trifolium repens]|nr:hypothetical protein P8452_26221 [Trifolium repens]